MDDAWCVLGEFNAVLYKGDRLGGDDIHDYEIKHFAEWVTQSGLQEMRCKGSYFTWTNKKVWSQLDRVFSNTYWYGTFDYCQVKYLSNALSDHTPMLIEITASPKPQSSFQFCDMWVRDTSFHPMVHIALPTNIKGDPGKKLSKFLLTIRKQLRALNKCKYVDLKSQQEQARLVLTQTQQAHGEQPENSALLQHESLACE